MGNEDLRRHIRERHQRKFSCRRCPYSSQRASNLNRHYKQMHGPNQSGPQPRRRRERRQSPRPSMDTTDALSINASPSSHQEPITSGPVSPTRPSPIRTSGKPLAMMMRDLQSGNESDGESQPQLQPSTAPTPQPDDKDQHDTDVHDVASTSTIHVAPPAPSSIAPVILPVRSTTAALSDAPRLLASVEEHRTTKVFVNGVAIRKTESTVTYPALVPRQWDQDVKFDYGLFKK